MEEKLQDEIKEFLDEPLKPLSRPSAPIDGRNHALPTMGFESEEVNDETLPLKTFEASKNLKESYTLLQ